MRVIDAHIHYCPGEDYFDTIAVNAGHKNTAEHLKEEYERLEIACGVVMGNEGLNPDVSYHGFMRYCVGVDSNSLGRDKLENSVELLEQHLKREDCVGIKLYPGYSPVYITDPVFEPVYELAEEYEKPVAIHMGTTAGLSAYLKYCHPLTLDEAAVKHPYVQLVMCHFGNPWLVDAAAVLDKNANVAADLTGIVEGHIDGQFYEEQEGYLELLRVWLRYLRNDNHIMFGTDWPLVNIEEYIGLIARLFPEKSYDKIFFENANRIYRLGL